MERSLLSRQVGGLILKRGAGLPGVFCAAGRLRDRIGQVPGPSEEKFGKNGAVPPGAKQFK